MNREMTLNQLSLSQIREGYREKKFSPLEIVKSCLKRIKVTDPKIKAFISVFDQEALQDAKLAQKKLAGDPDALSNFPLLGIPVSVKDIFCTKGLLTTAASNILRNFIPPYDATVVAKLKSAGGIIVGKTNMDAFAHGSSTETSDFFITQNPWNLKFLPGGSSGGSAASIITDQTIVSVGTETAGSIRQPSAWCGVTGLKPTYGRVSRYGVIAMASSLDSPGPMTKNVWDAAFLLKVIAGHDPADATTSEKVVPNYLESIEEPVGGTIIGLPKEYFADWINTEVLDQLEKAINVLKKIRVKFKEISLFDPRYAISVYTVLQRSEVSSNLARYDGIRYGFSRSDFGKEAKRRIMLGSYTLSAGYYDRYYRKALKVRTKIMADFNQAFKEVDLILGPTSPSTALAVGAAAQDPTFGENQDVLVEPSSIAGLPGLNLPCGFSKQGLPIGMQIIGPQFSENLILKVGHIYQKLTDWHQLRPVWKD